MKRPALITEADVNRCMKVAARHGMTVRVLPDGTHWIGPTAESYHRPPAAPDGTTPRAAFHERIEETEDLARIRLKAARKFGAGIYFVGFQHFIKIGYATNLLNRISHLQTGIPVPLLLYGAIRGTPEIEIKLHRKFRDHHMRGEWFWRTQILHNYICEASEI